MPRTILAAVAVAGLTAAVHASPAPVPMSVTGVAADDVLNLRAEPWADARKVGELPPDATGVEASRCVAVLRERIVPEGTAGASRWCRVSLGAQAGWANARFLAPVSGPAPAPLYSAGPAAGGGTQRSFLVSSTEIGRDRHRAVTRHVVRRATGGDTLEEATTIVDCARRPGETGIDRDARNLWWAVCRGQMQKVKG